MAGRRTMAEWINESLLDSNMGKLTAISCVHRILNSQQEVYTVKIGEGGVDANALSSMFQSKAQYAVNDTPGNQAFFLLAFYDGNSEPKGRFSFRIDGGADLGHGETEPPTTAGVMSQQMRMTEAGFQFFFRQSAEMVKQTIEFTKYQGNTIKMLMEENRDALILAKEVILSQAANQDERMMKQLQFQRDTKERESLAKLGPALVNSMTGREIFPQAVADTALVESVIENVTEEQIKKLAEILPPHIMAPLAARAADHFEKQKAAAKAAETALLTEGKGVEDGDKPNQQSSQPVQQQQLTRTRRDIIESDDFN